MHEILRNAEIQTDPPPIPTRRTDFEKLPRKKRTCYLLDFIVSVEQCVKIKERKKDKYLDLARE